jgi:hypothetical protein
MRIVFQIAVAVLSLAAIISVMSKKKENLLGPMGAFFWVIFWIALVSIVSVPSITQRIADLIGIGRGVDLVMYVSIAVVFFLVFKLHIKVEGLKRDVTRLVRSQALEEVEKKEESL